MNRRNYLRNLISNTIATFEELRGVPNFKLADIESLSDEGLKNIVPKIVNGSVCIEENGDLFIRRKGSDSRFCSYKINPTKKVIFDHFSKMQSIKHISYVVSKRLDLKLEKTFFITKHLFLDLVKRGFCIPANRSGRNFFLSPKPITQK